MIEKSHKYTLHNQSSLCPQLNFLMPDPKTVRDNQNATWLWQVRMSHRRKFRVERNLNHLWLRKEF